MPVDTDATAVEETSATASPRQDVLQDPLGREDGKKPKDPPSLKKLEKRTQKILDGRMKFFERIVPLNEGGDWAPEEGQMRRTMMQVRLTQMMGRDWIQVQMLLDGYRNAKTNSEKRTWLSRLANELKHVSEQLTQTRIMGACTPEAAEMLEELEQELLQMYIDMVRQSFEILDERDVEAVDQVKTAMREALVL